MKHFLYLLFLPLLLMSFSCHADNHEYVDLGLPSGTLWATCNVGATKPTEYGDLFAWGETSTKETFTEETYKFLNIKKGEITKYNTESKFGTIDNKTELETQDDAASVNWGDSWRMPTEKEMQELVAGCLWTLTDNYKGSGVAGRIGKSKTNGNTIFLPSAGESSRGEGRFSEGSVGVYWSSSLDSSNSGGAYNLYFYAYDLSVRSIIYETGDGGRNKGYSVRAVCTSKKNNSNMANTNQTVIDTLIESNNVDNHDYVDLGLLSGTLWAKYNVGASKLTEYGDLFAWGETSTKETYTKETYKFYKKKDGKNVISKYNSKSFFGTVDNKTVLAPQDDAASVLWGGSWRMPTLEEMDELVSCCKWEWADDYEGSGVAGIIGKSKTNGNTIFLPSAGESSVSGGRVREGSVGYYWSSSLDSSNTDEPYYLISGSGGIAPSSNNNRYNGFSVRAVCPYKK